MVSLALSETLFWTGARGEYQSPKSISSGHKGGDKVGFHSISGTCMNR